MTLATDTTRHGLPPDDPRRAALHDAIHARPSPRIRTRAGRGTPSSHATHSTAIRSPPAAAADAAHPRTAPPAWRAAPTGRVRASVELTMTEAD
jgi:hypothetical protein